MEKMESEHFLFKERFYFILKSGLEEFQFKLYKLADEEEQQIDHFSLKIIDYLHKLIDQKDFALSLTNNKGSFKIVLKWIYNADYEKLNEMQQKQLQLEKQMFKMEDNYQQAVKSCQKLQAKQPTVSKLQEEWGVFLIAPKQPQIGGSVHAPRNVKTVGIDLSQMNSQVLAPTKESLAKMDNEILQSHMPGSIMNNMIQEINQSYPQKQAKSQAMSSHSVMSSIRPGAFFKIMDSPFKLKMMQHYEALGLN
mmetsp:Transcript_17396/g.16594  ORF Transcript_17396/g.16594 Transcript_17396/m.16594 type:complete len:251 (+) Transcript_17396:305-1057(+)